MAEQEPRKERNRILGLLNEVSCVQRMMGMWVSPAFTVMFCARLALHTDVIIMRGSMSKVERFIIIYGCIIMEHHRLHRKDIYRGFRILFQMNNQKEFIVQTN